MNQRLELVLIEDNPHDIEIFLNVIEWIGMNDKVRVFSDGRAALDYLQEREIDERTKNPLPGVIFLDLKMPLMDGNEVLQILRTDPRTARIPVVILTSSSLDDDIRQSYALGSNSYVVKPLEFEKFADTIRDIVNYWRNINVRPVT